MANESSTLQKSRTATNKNELLRTDLKPLLTMQEVMKYLGISRTTFYKYELQYRIPHVYIDNEKRCVRFRLSDVENYLKRNS